MFLELDSKILKFSLKSGQCRLFQGSSSRQSLFLVVQVAPFMQRDCHLLENQDTVTRSKGLSFKFFQLSIRRLQCAQKAAQGTQEDVSAITDKLVPQRCHDLGSKQHICTTQTTENKTTQQRITEPRALELEVIFRDNCSKSFLIQMLNNDGGSGCN